MNLPINDWQFWAVTGIFLVSLSWLLRGVLPIPILSKRHKQRKKQTRVTLTVDGKAAK